MTAEAGAPPAAPVTGLSHVQLVVADLPASTAWYSTVLGLEQLASGDGYVALRHRPARMVVVLSAGRRPTGSGPGAPGGSLDHLAFAVPDGDALADWADHLTSRGVRHDGVALEDGNPSLVLRDPDGNTIELVAPGRSRR